MAGEDYTSDGSVYHEILNLIKDGEVYNFDSLMKSVTPKRGLIAKLLDNVQYVKNLAVASLPLAGGLVTGKIVLDTPGARILLRPPQTMANGDSTLSLNAQVFRVPGITAARTYKLPTLVLDDIGTWITIVKHNNANFDAVINRPEDDSTVVTFSAAISVYSSATFVARSGVTTAKWSLLTWAGGAVPTHDP